MKYLPIDSQLFIDNRSALQSRLKSRSIAVFNANDIMPTNADGTMLFRQNNDLFYFSGIDQEESILIIYPDAPKSEWKEILLLKETNEHIRIWEGNKLSKKQAVDVSGIKTVYWLQDFENIFAQIVFECEFIYLNSNEHVRSTNVVQTRDARFIAYIREHYPLHKLERLAPIMNELRCIKHQLETSLIRIAIEITHKAFMRCLQKIKPGMMEYEVEAEITHEFLWNRATRHAYVPIIASGINACVLHYNDNNKALHDGDLVLMDFGAEYANYAADLTRTIPVNGKFTQRQKQVYKAVLDIQKQARTLLVKGNDLDGYNKSIALIVTEQLVNLGLLDPEEVKNQNPDKPLYKKYFMHGTSHFLGLDVHDVGNRYSKFQQGMVFTCEPGIYIPEEAIGIRLENNILITENGNVDLMEQIPIEADEIETLMQRK